MQFISHVRILTNKIVIPLQYTRNKFMMNLYDLKFTYTVYSVIKNPHKENTLCKIYIRNIISKYFYEQETNFFYNLYVIFVLDFIWLAS